MTTHKYILNEKGEPVAEPDLMTWARWFEDAHRHVAGDKIGRSRVSTVFLGIDYNFYDEGPPVLWETMVFGGKLDGQQSRCAGTREQAEAAHGEIVKRVRQAERF